MLPAPIWRPMAQFSEEITVPPVSFVSATDPLAGWGPAQPSPDEPPQAVQDCAPTALQERVTRSPVLAPEALAVSVMGCVASPGAVSAPVEFGSSNDLSVLLVVELVRSAVEVQTPDSEVNSAVTVSGRGVGGGLTGQTPAEFSPFVSAARLAVPTPRLLGLKSADPEAPAPTFPSPFTTPQ